MTGTVPALDLPQIAVACPTCQAQPGDPCTSHGGTRTRRHDTHQTRTAAWAEVAQAVTESLDELFRGADTQPARKASS